MRYLLAIVFLFYMAIDAIGQNNACNKLGVWLWYLEITGYQSHDLLAEKLKSLEIKRVYVKVADGKVNTTIWPELTDKSVVDAYKKKGIEVWAWSYNYPGNDSLQAEALYLAIKTGYQGYVVDVETEFDNKTIELRNIFSSFDNAKRRATNDQIAPDDFKLYATTWGNPKDHNFKIAEIDPFVDGYMPQTYVENWGNTYINNISKWIEEGNKEFRLLGATKPIHHIISTEKGILSASQINNFFDNSGGESSIWRIPGADVPQSIWNTWQNINWTKDFCTSSGTSGQDETAIFSPNPADNELKITNGSGPYFIYDFSGRAIKHGIYKHNIDISSLIPGLYVVRLKSGKGYRFIKN
ncbi:MAG: T9SS type A sorting domain-containing protein [Saprospiraceae bacterium]|nr:T9SS type A sorting domain-containing protein [Saprospiraceae bacterium]MBP6238212.1 T9SS type A sorting domain-containing protein [Saprospiraceae bacterium]MBP6566953.1 T9SS type A sorting domain-containing protein [Saprospiraceae bacterium]